jgi:hypothetical protein
MIPRRRQPSKHRRHRLESIAPVLVIKTELQNSKSDLDLKLKYPSFKTGWSFATVTYRPGFRSSSSDDS